MISQEKLITVIIPCYNVEKYLARCLNSLINQSYKNLEILIINDGSSDDSLAIAKKFAAQDQRITIYSKENGGLSSARNFGIQKAKGEYLSFIDSDDFIDPKFYEILYKNIITDNYLLSICDFANVYEEIDSYPVTYTKAYQLSTEKIIAEVLAAKKFSVSACNKLYHKSLFQDLKFEEGKIAEDAFIMIKLMAKCPQVIVTDSKLYIYCHRKNSITTSKFSLKYLDVIEAYQLNYQFIQSNFPNLIQLANMRRIWSHFYVLDRLYPVYQNYPQLEKELISFLKTNSFNILTYPQFNLTRKLSFIALLIHKNLYYLILRSLKK